MDCKTLATLTSKDLIVTANLRLTALLQRQYDETQAKRGLNAWLPPTILPMTTWLNQLWQQNTPGRYWLLSPLQEQQIWQTIIEQDSSQIIMQTRHCAQLVQQAWQALHMALLDLSTIKPDDNQDVLTFLRWAQGFENYCEQQHCVSASKIPQAILKLHKEKSLNVPDNVYVVGFDEVPKALITVLTTLFNQDTIHLVETSTQPDSTQQLHFSSPEAELQAMAAWAKDQLEQNPRASIGCVIPKLQQLRTEVEHVFTHAFSVPHLIPGAQQALPPFNISAASNITQYAIIDTALDALKLLVQPLRMETTSKLLQSPYLCQNEHDACLGALIDLRLREYATDSLPFDYFLKVFSKIEHDYPETTWLKRWRAFATCTTHRTQQQLPSAWVDHSHKALTQLGWPGGRTLNSMEYQVHARWLKHLQDLASLDSIVGTITLAQFIHLLDQSSRELTFQIQSVEVQPIQILGTLESAGYEFDALWVMGLTDREWPTAAKPNPFLPYALQVQHQMPHASPERELFFAERVTQRWLHSGKRIYFSCALANGDQHTSPSQLLKDVPVIEWEALQLNRTDSLVEACFRSSELETFSDFCAPPVTPDETIRGGSWLLKQQSDCPFKAFATIRCQAEELPNAKIGLSAAERGIILHDCLERLWEHIQTHKNLVALTNEQQQELLHNTTQQAIQDYQRQDPTTNASLIELEQARLVTLLSQWLDLEKERQPFNVIAQEATREINIAGLKLTVRIDRIDQLSHGRQMIIDYKTSLSSASGWFNERISQPQLPAYCVFDHTSQYSGMAFAQLRPGQLKFKGVLAQEYYRSDDVPGVDSIEQYTIDDITLDWQSSIKRWQEQLTELATEFQQGHAEVSPRDNSSCQYCHLHALCRVNEL